MLADVAESGTIFTSLIHWPAITSKTQFPRFVVNSFSRISMTTNSSGTVAGKCCMPSLFRRKVTLLFVQPTKLCATAYKSSGIFGPRNLLGRNWYNRRPLGCLDISAWWLRRNTRATRDYCKSFKPHGGTKQHILITEREWNPLSLVKTSRYGEIVHVATLFYT